MEEKMIAIYHRVYRRENFEKAAKDLMGLVYATQQQNPGVPRALFLDIDGHRNKAGGYDADMYELQKEFAINVLLPFVKELHLPLGTVKNLKEQCNDVPGKIVIQNERNERDDRDDSLEKLYIENYSNKEFMSEEDVYEYMQKVSKFLRDYGETEFILREKEEYDFCFCDDKNVN